MSMKPWKTPKTQAAKPVGENHEEVCCQRKHQAIWTPPSTLRIVASKCLFPLKLNENLFVRKLLETIEQLTISADDQCHDQH
jgi:hypothetical protein